MELFREVVGGGNLVSVCMRVAGACRDGLRGHGWSQLKTLPLVLVWMGLPSLSPLRWVLLDEAWGKINPRSVWVGLLRLIGPALWMVGLADM